MQFLLPLSRRRVVIMPRIKRRQFLQFAGSSLAAIGLSQFDILQQRDRMSSVLAQSAPRKRALLVGINDYAGDVPDLRGCVNDAKMQYNLLVHRFGFNPDDILLLTDQDATREGILSAFETHLIENTGPNDIVVFHYSGHGSMVIDPEPIQLPATAGYEGFEGYNGTMMPHDARVNIDGAKVNDIMGKTLFLLMKKIPTDRVTVVIDCCHSGGGTRGDLTYRAVEPRVRQEEASPSEAELAYQDKLMADLNLSESQLKTLREQGIAKGVALGSAQANQLAADASFGSGSGLFYAGAFTYALTHYLWQQPNSFDVERVFVDLARSTRNVAQTAKLTQDPIYEVAPDSNYESQPIFFINPQDSRPSAEAVVLENANGQVQFWLGGVSSQSLDAFQEGAIFSLIDDSGNEIGQIEQTDRRELIGYGTLRGQARSAPTSGMLLRERIRGVPADLSLRIGLDPSLGDELEAARSRLNSINRIEPVSLGGNTTPHYLLGRMTTEAIQQGQRRSVSRMGEVDTIGLFSSGLVPVEASFGDTPTETIDDAINRLRPRLKMLLAGRMLRSILNSDTSNLNVRVEVNPIREAGGVPSRSGSAAVETSGVVAQTVATNATELRPGTEIQIKVTNEEQQNLYIGVLVIGSTGRITVLHPVDWEAPESAALLEPGQLVEIPRSGYDPNDTRDYCTDPSDEFHFCIDGPSGYFEILTLASTEPLRDALKGLQQIAEDIAARTGDPLSLDSGSRDEPDDVINDLLGDIDRITRADVEVRSGTRSVDTQKLAALTAIIKVVE